VARLLGDGVRTVEYWVERFNEDGFAGLVEGERPGRPRKLSIEQLEELEVILRASPRVQSVSANLWDGKTLSHWIKQRWGCGTQYSAVPATLSPAGVSAPQTQTDDWTRRSRIAERA
jgi:transposase